MVDPTLAGINFLVGADPGDIWDEFAPIGDGCVGVGCGTLAGGLMVTGRTGAITGGCQLTPGTCPAPYVNRSPRLRAAVVFDADNFLNEHRTGRLTIYITGFVGMFVKGTNAANVEAYITDIDMTLSGSNLTANTSSSLRSVILVR